MLANRAYGAGEDSQNRARARFFNMKTKGSFPTDAGEELTAHATHRPDPSALGAHFDEETAIAALAFKYYQEAGFPKDREDEHWKRAREEYARTHHARASSKPKIVPKTTKADALVEEAMQLGM